MDAGRLKRVGGREEEYGSATRAASSWIVLWWCKQVTAHGGIGLGESWHVQTHAYIYRYLPSRARAQRFFSLLSTASMCLLGECLYFFSSLRLSTYSQSFGIYCYSLHSTICRYAKHSSCSNINQVCRGRDTCTHVRE